MKEPLKHPVLPFEWSGVWDEMDAAHYVYAGVHWLEDFGPFSAGEHFEHLNVDFESGEIVLW